MSRPSRNRHLEEEAPARPIATAVRQYGRYLSAFHGARLSILIFHRVLPKPDPLRPWEPDARLFEARMRWVASAFNVLPLIEASRRLSARSLPPNAACITFDDGYADNVTIAAPILANVRIPGTFFIASGYLDGGRMWNDTVIEAVRIAEGPSLDLSSLQLGVWPCTNDVERLAAIDGLLSQLKYLEQAERQSRVNRIAELVGLPAKSDLMMTSQQVRELRRLGMSIGGHTVSHPILTKLAADEARREIADGRAALQEIVREPVRTFAYPNGKPIQDYDATHVDMVREMGFDAAVSTAWGVSTEWSDRFQLARFTPWDKGIAMFGLRLAQNLSRTPVFAPVDA